MEITKINGTVHVINETFVMSEKFKKRELVIQTEDKFPQFVTIQFVNDKCDLLSNLRIGDFVSINYNLRGREWTKDNVTKYFNTVEGWSIELKNKNSFDERLNAGLNKKEMPNWMNDNTDLPI
jgi:hypothetical protein